MDKDYNILKYEYNKQEYFMNDNLEKTSYNQEIHLNDEIFIKLINEFKKIEELFNYDVDIEWTIKNDIIYILQVRPITINI
jgi:phosphoenolpyruvate synthase/pyruvate phosphate dikinase